MSSFCCVAGRVSPLVFLLLMNLVMQMLLWLIHSHTLLSLHLPIATMSRKIYCCNWAKRRHVYWHMHMDWHRIWRRNWLDTRWHSHFSRFLKSSSNGVRDQFILIFDKHLWSDMKTKVNSKEEFNFEPIHFGNEYSSNLCIVRVIVVCIVKELGS